MGTLPPQRETSAAGFTLLELLLAAALFTVVAGAAFALFAQHLPLFNQQQSLAAVNIAMRNATAQLQMDIVNAGANWYTGINIPNWPVGVAVTNHPTASGGDCRTGTPPVYGVNCFDQINVITADGSTPPAIPSNNAGGCVTTTSAATVYVGPAPVPPATPTGYGSAALATAAAGHYHNGDQILFVTSDGSQYTTMKLTADATTGTIGASATKYYVTLTVHSTTDATTPGLNTTTNDPYDMTTHANTMLGQLFCSNTAPTSFVLRLTPITYKVDITTDPNNPTLVRVENGATATLTEQVIGFKVGVSLFNNASDTDTTTYAFDAANYNNGTSVPYNYTLVRSVMISLIGRTKPVTDPTYVFRNSFDGGAYEIQGVSVVVNPRNMSMTD
jgi:prepilin-type N-terminal cleavage/methylation domain-containing protein